MFVHIHILNIDKCIDFFFSLKSVQMNTLRLSGYVQYEVMGTTHVNNVRCKANKRSYTSAAGVCGAVHTALCQSRCYANGNCQISRSNNPSLP